MRAMKNIFGLFAMDVRHLMANAITALVVVGLVLVPALYAWFTTLGFWDPYARTGNIKVAVANCDEGYQSDLIPVKVNAGESVTSALRANSQFDWEFVSESEAVDGIYAGRYYASIVIPPSFSRDLMTVFTDDIHHADIVYYTNQKENAIAPRVTDAGASTLQQQIDETFTKTVGDVALGTTSNLMEFVNGDGIANYGQALVRRLDSVTTELDGAAAQTAVFASMVDSTAALSRAAAGIVDEEAHGSLAAKPLLDEAQGALDAGSDAVDDAVTLADEAFDQASEAFDSLSASVDEALDSLDKTPQAAAGTLNATAEDLQGIIDAYRSLRNSVAAAGGNETLLGRIDQAILALANAQGELYDGAETLDSGAQSAREAKASLEGQIAEARAAMDEVHGAFDSNLRKQLEALDSTMASVRSDADNLSQKTATTAKSLADTADSLAGSLDEVRSSLEAASQTLQQSADSLRHARAELSRALAAGDLERVRALIGSDPGRIAQFLAAPTTLKTTPVWAMADNGSAMSPFYTSLSLWIGAIFMVALMSVNVAPALQSRLNRPTPGQLYLGRYGVFALLGLLQATIVVTGNVFFLGVQCEHLVLYYLAAWAAALVFTNIVYTLTVSFGNVGKAIAIIGLVLQLAGSGGIFPVQMSADFFQAVYPWLPFSHSMEMFQGCEAGIYGNHYWLSMAKLLGFLVPSLLLGLALRRPVMRLNNYVLAKLDETKLV